MHTVTPSMVIGDCAKAIEFYKRALDAQEVSRFPSPDGKSIWHAELRVGDSMVFMNDEMPGMGRSAPTVDAPAPVTMWLYVTDCDAAFRRAVGAGAKPTMQPTDMFWGDRVASRCRPPRLSLVVRHPSEGPDARGDATRRRGLRSIHDRAARMTVGHHAVNEERHGFAGALPRRPGGNRGPFRGPRC
jgi:uncharacterized glyoxalase superfamily protein PhnB